MEMDGLELSSETDLHLGRTGNYPLQNVERVWRKKSVWDETIRIKKRLGRVASPWTFCTIAVEQVVELAATD